MMLFNSFYRVYWYPGMLLAASVRILGACSLPPILTLAFTWQNLNCFQVLIVHSISSWILQRAEVSPVSLDMYRIYIFIYTFESLQQVMGIRNWRARSTDESCRVMQGLDVWLVPSKAQQRRNHLWSASPRLSWWITLRQSKVLTFDPCPSNLL
jgi:hypothetical protein